MVRLINFTSILVISISLLTYSCSKGGEGGKKGAIDEITDKAAEIAVERIRAPIKQAESARALVEEGMKEANDLLEEE